MVKLIDKKIMIIKVLKHFWSISKIRSNRVNENNFYYLYIKNFQFFIIKY